jgi:hypothetical protein
LILDYKFISRVDPRRNACEAASIVHLTGSPGAGCKTVEFEMLKKLLLGVAALAVVGTVAYAEDTASNGQQNAQVAQADDNNDAAPAPGNDGPQANNNGNGGGNGGGWWEWHHRWHGQGDHGGGQGGGDRWGMGQGGPGHGGMGGPGMHGPGGPGMMMGMMGPHNGFRIQLGKGISVGVMCGKEAIKDCVADAQPLIDAAKAAAQAQASAPAPAK